MAARTVTKSLNDIRPRGDKLMGLLTMMSKDGLRQLIETKIAGDARVRFFGANRRQLSKERAIEGLVRLLATSDGPSTKEAILQAWLQSTPAVIAASHETLGRDDPFAAATSEEFYQRLRGVLAPAILNALRAIAPPPRPQSTGNPSGLRNESRAEIDPTAVEPSAKAHEPKSTSKGSHEGGVPESPGPSEPPDRPLGAGGGSEVDTGRDVRVLQAGLISATIGTDRFGAAETTEPGLLSVPPSGGVSGLRDQSVANLRRFFGASLPIFDSVVARDRWALQHGDGTGPLGESFAERLPATKMLLGDAQRTPTVAESDRYATLVARQLEAAERWSEAESYWLAAFRGPALGSTDEAARGYLRTALLDAGLAGSDSELGAKELLEAALRSNDARIRKALARSIVTVSIVDEHFYEELRLSNQLAEALGRLLRENCTYVPAPKGRRVLTTTGELIRQAAQELSRIDDRLRDEVRQVVTAPSVARLQERRKIVLQMLGKLDEIVAEPDRSIGQSVRRLLGDRLSAYLKDQPQPDETFRDLVDEAEQALDLASRRGSYLGSCLLTPLIVASCAAVTNDYEAQIRSIVADLEVELVKRNVAALAEVSTLEVEIRNRGGGDAQDCYLRLEGKPNELRFEGDGVLLGCIPAGHSAVASFKAEWATPADIVEIEWCLEYADRSGEHEAEGAERISRQEPLDWDAVERIPRYELASIREPSKLKGRKDTLAELLRGFQSRTSFTITGQKRVGKTSLTLVILEELRRDGDVLGVYLTVGDMDIIAAAEHEILDRFAESLSSSIADEYEGDREKTPPNSAFPNARGLTGLKRFLDGLRRSDPELRIVIAFDDFDAVPPALLQGDTGRALFEWVRSRINTDQIVFLFVGSERLPGIIYGRHGQTLNVVQKVELDYLEPDAFESLVRDPTEGIIDWEGEAVREVETWSARNPFYGILICQRVWNRAAIRRDRCVARRDIRQVVDHLAKTAEQNYFQHFWADSPRPEDERRELEETKSAEVVLALSRHQRDPLVYVPREEVIAECQRGGLKDSPGPQIAELLARGVLEADRENSDLIRFRVPLFGLWLKERGSGQVRESQVARSPITARTPNERSLSREEIEEAGEGLTYRSQPVSKDDVRGWLEQFGPIDRQRLMRRVLLGVRKYAVGDADFQVACQELHKMTLREASDRDVTPTTGRTLEPNTAELVHHLLHWCN